MLNSEIKYKTSTDYKELYRLLKEGNIIAGFISIDTQNCNHRKYSKLAAMSYNEKFKFFDLGFLFFEQFFYKKDFETICLDCDVRFIPLNNN